MGDKVTPTSTEIVDKPQHRKRAKKSNLLPALLVIVGLIVIIYPVVSTQWNNWQQNRAAAEYAKLQKSVPAEVSDKEWEDAHRYNEERADGPILDPWIDRFVPDNQAYQDYLAVLNSTDAMGRLIIPSVKTDLPIYHDTQEDTLQRGVGHLFGSDLPVGGEGTHSVLTGHTGLSNAILFDNLKDVKEGDSFFIQVACHKLKYQVDQIKAVLPDEVESLRAEPGKDLVTLVTCTPYGINTHRLLVRGHQVPITEEEKTMLDETQGAIWQRWMYALSAVFIIGLILLGWWLTRQARRAKNQQLNPENRHNNEGEL
ncbi:class C sortase [Corynebacterium diphtheriae]|uniref:class C sortase n=1 Tax=Corynebacterium diphtheriae TaxID=1717 RepID=UPI000893227D|nr:class C sortase [Corynebacterium diphtheriae]OFI55278.1 class C sortase [Corynebacterium diphtheriae]OWM40508.1 class C sortase [Corynebacterium diphtheriae]OWM58348.1 class C sortase [Corynebacterium diphtheriae]OWN05233.1 sortase [Corynebacterium diphtheriae bv. gravis]OWO59271.1 sortase [Corynebacterium diphtheriae bv. mitis]